MTKKQREAESVAAAKQLSYATMRYSIMMVLSTMVLYLSFGPNPDLLKSHSSLPGFFILMTCVLILGGFLGTLLNGYRLWNFMRITKL